jgi:hypothetical protein
LPGRTVVARLPLHLDFGIDGPSDHAAGLAVGEAVDVHAPVERLRDVEMPRFVLVGGERPFRLAFGIDRVAPLQGDLRYVLGRAGLGHRDERVLERREPLIGAGGATSTGQQLDSEIAPPGM